MKDFHDFWLRKDNWTFKEAACLLNGVDPARITEIDFNLPNPPNNQDHENDEIQNVLLYYSIFKTTNWEQYDELSARVIKSAINWSYFLLAYDKDMGVSEELRSKMERYRASQKDRQNESDTGTADLQNETNLVRTNHPYPPKKLIALLDAIDEFWTGYEPDDYSTAPTNETVKNWLIKEKGIKAGTAGYIASIIHADDVPSGPRPPKKRKK